MIATSERTALVVMRSAVRIGRSTETTRGTLAAPRRVPSPNIRPNMTKISTGMPTLPKKPSGSRTKIFVSSQASFQRPRNMSVSNRVAGQAEEHILERRELGAKVGDGDPVGGDALDHAGHDVCSRSADRQLRTFARDRLNLRNGPEAFQGGQIVGDDDHGALWAMSLHELARRADVDDAAVVDDGHSVAEALGFFHQVRRQEHGLAALPDVAHQVPDRAARLGIESGRQ